jgi:hypothetical protein
MQWLCSAGALNTSCAVGAAVTGGHAGPSAQVLSGCCACRSFALPALLPLISPDLSLTDSEGALLTVGYTVRAAL